MAPYRDATCERQPPRELNEPKHFDFEGYGGLAACIIGAVLLYLALMSGVFG